ncbi:hypothetical protein F4776DRAFT_663500 [Hypoxylon sp. NC0597]|nr:hypothetical protein F4776DRAFT_663500 [Hypoxylon sp. NC0597]
MVTPMSVVSTNQRRDDDALPLELQEMIWEFTLPSMRPVRLLPYVSGAWEFYGSNFKLPQPPKSEYRFSRIALTRDVPRTNDILVALRVCQVSRNLALKSFNLLLIPRASITPSFFIGPNDIIDISFLSPTTRDLLKTRKKNTEDEICKLQDLASSMAFQTNTDSEDYCQIELERLLYGMDSGYLSVIIRRLPSYGDLLTTDQVIIRFSELEEWFFGSRLTMATFLST